MDHQVVFLAVVVAVCLVGCMDIIITLLKTYWYPPIIEPPSTLRTFDEIIDASIPPVFQPTRSLWKYFVSELQSFNYYFRFSCHARKNKERNSDIRLAMELWSNIIGSLFVSMALCHLLYRTSILSTSCDSLTTENSCGSYAVNPLRSCEWNDQAMRCDERLISGFAVVFLALVVNVLVALLSPYPLMLARYLDDIIASLQLRTLYVSATETAKELDLEFAGKELDTLQQKRGTLLRAARATVLRADYDYCTIESEVKAAGTCAIHHHAFPWIQRPEAFESPSQHLRNYLRFVWKAAQYRLYAAGDPRQSALFLQHSFLLDPALVPHRLRAARQQAHSLRQKFAAFGSDRTDRQCAELFLVSLFFVYWFSGSTMRALHILLLQDAHAYTLRALRLPRRRRIHIPRALLTVMVIVAISSVCLVAAVVFLFPSRHTVALVLVTSLVAHFLHVAVLSPLRIAITQLYAPSFAREEFLQLHRVLKARGRYLLSRNANILSPRRASDLVQHFHPACRLARQVPSFPFARLLVTLRDHDLIAASQAPRRAPPYGSVPLWAAASPLVLDSLEVALLLFVAAFQRISFIVDRTWSKSARAALHVVLQLPWAFRQGAWDAILAVALALMCWSLVAIHPSLAVLWGLCLWSFVARCFVFRGPLTLACDNAYFLYRTVNNYFVREKPVRHPHKPLQRHGTVSSIA